MSETVDANVLIYASNAASPHFDGASAVLRDLASGPGLVYLFWPAILAYLRVVTHRGLLQPPLLLDDALANVESLLALPHVRAVSERPGFLASLREVGQPLPAVGKLVHDAHIVALMRQHGVDTIWTYDRDFRKFDGIRVADALRRP